MTNDTKKSEQTGARRGRGRRTIVKKFLFAFVAIFLGLAAIEGTLSLLMFAYDLVL